MLNQKIALSVTLFTGVLLIFALSETGSRQATHRISTAGGDNLSPGEGVWAGYWKADGDPGAGKSLVCKTVQIGPDTWTATFHAVCDKDYAFTMDVPGRRVDDRVEFAVTVNLGEDYGGEYHWRGAVVGGEFDGVYTNAHYNGTFHMAKATDRDVPATGISCEIPQKGGLAQSQPTP
jgi:hypothetical protein